MVDREKEGGSEGEGARFDSRSDLACNLKSLSLSLCSFLFNSPASNFDFGVFETDSHGSWQHLVIRSSKW